MEGLFYGTQIPIPRIIPAYSIIIQLIMARKLEAMQTPFSFFSHLTMITLTLSITLILILLKIDSLKMSLTNKLCSTLLSLVFLFLSWYIFLINRVIYIHLTAQALLL